MKRNFEVVRLVAEAVGPAPTFHYPARERLLRLGAGALSDAELISALLAESDTKPAERLLAEAGGLRPLCTEDAAVLEQQQGVGGRRAALLLAAVELGRRVLREPERRPRLTSPAQIFQYLSPTLQGLRREVFRVLCFNTRSVLLRDSQVAEGTANQCLVDPREVFSAAITSRATAIALCHNHPSGDPTPSREDLELTRRLVEAGRLLGVRVVDHIVVGDNTFVSMLEQRQVAFAV